MAGPDDLYQLAAEFLAACGVALEGSYGGPIVRQYVSHAVPAWDDEQLVVWSPGYTIGDTSPLQPPLQPAHRIDMRRSIVIVALTAQVVRRVPVLLGQGEVPVNPDPADIDDAARVTLGDLWAIRNHVRARYVAGALFASTGGAKRELWFDPAVAINDAGGFGGWNVNIRVQLDGFEEA